MKLVVYYSLLLLFCLQLSSCVGAKKYRALQDEKEQIRTTLLTTKEELAVAKRELNKLEDKSSSSQEQLDASIEDLQIKLTGMQQQLKASQAQNQQLREQNSAQREAYNQQNSRYEKQLQPVLKATASLKKEQAQLQKLYQDLEGWLEQDTMVQLRQELEAGRLVVSLEHAYFFSSERNVSNAGRKALETIGQLAKQYPTMYIDMVGHSLSSSDNMANWKNSTRKPFALMYYLLKGGVANSQIRLIGQGQYAPLMPGNSREAAAYNARTELIFHYRADRFVPVLVQP